MSTLEEIKAAAAKLGPDEQVELFRWWVESDAFKKRQLAALKHEIARGIDDLENGRYQSYDDSNVMHLAEEVVSAGKQQLKKTRQKPRP